MPAPITKSIRRLLPALAVPALALAGAIHNAASADALGGVQLPPVTAVTDPDYYADGQPSQAKVELGRLLFFDKVLSGNRNISCATCHHPKHASADAVALPLGEGPIGLGPERRVGAQLENAVHERVPRNSPALFNLGAREFERLFHDGRVESDPNGYFEGGFITPAKWKLPEGLENVLAAQAMFPVTSSTEMAGQQGENPIADAVALNNAAGPGGVWELLAQRLAAIPEYVERFKRAFPEQIQGAEDIRFVHAANAISAFESHAFRADNSAFDLYLRGVDQALDQPARQGMRLFYGKAGCGDCHTGKFQTDHSFHAVAMPQIGPGKGDGSDASYWQTSGQQAFVEDYGRGKVTVRPEDNYRFRTPSLRNVARTGPWGHSGAYDSLEAVVRHHLDPVASLRDYQLPEAHLQPLNQVVELTAQGSQLQHTPLNEQRRASFAQRDAWVQSNQTLRANIAAANELEARNLNDEEVAQLIAFLHSLTDPDSVDRSDLVPERVPSGLPVLD